MHHRPRTDRDISRVEHYSPETVILRGSESDDPNLVGVVRMPERRPSAARSIWRRVAIAFGALGLSVLVVYLGREGYRDVNEDGLSLLDAIYYATVSLSTTGYGDITPSSDGARLVNVLLITPLRVIFLLVLVGTTIELLTERSRQAFRVQRWRSRVRDHVVVVGYGTRAAPRSRRCSARQMRGREAPVRGGGDQPAPPGAGRRRRFGDRQRGRHPDRRAASGSRASGQVGRGRHEPRRHRRAGHTHRA